MLNGVLLCCCSYSYGIDVIVDHMSTIGLPIEHMYARSNPERQQHCAPFCAQVSVCFVSVNTRAKTRVEIVVCTHSFQTNTSADER